MIVTTTGAVEGRAIAEYPGIRAGEVVFGHETVLTAARAQALEHLERDAADRGANAIVGVSRDYEVVGEKGSMPVLVASGAAVRLAD